MAILASAEKENVKTAISQVEAFSRGIRIIAAGVWSARVPFEGLHRCPSQGTAVYIAEHGKGVARAI